MAILSRLLLVLSLIRGCAWQPSYGATTNTPVDIYPKTNALAATDSLLAVVNKGGGSNALRQLPAGELFNTVKSNSFVNRNLLFWDDFSTKTNTRSGPNGLGKALSTSIIGGTNHVWHILGTTAFQNQTNGYITNGYAAFDFSTNAGSAATYYCLNAGTKPNEVGIRLRWVTNAGQTAEITQVVLLQTPDENSLSNAFHFGFNRYWMDIGFYVPGVGVTNIDAGRGRVSGVIPIDTDVTISFRVDGNTLTVNYAGEIFSYTDARFASYGGKICTFEPYCNNQPTTRDLVRFLNVWGASEPRAGASPLSTFNTLTGNLLTSSNIIAGTAGDPLAFGVTANAAGGAWGALNSLGVIYGKNPAANYYSNFAGLGLYNGNLQQMLFIPTNGTFHLMATDNTISPFGSDVFYTTTNQFTLMPNLDARAGIKIGGSGAAVGKVLVATDTSGTAAWSNILSGGSYFTLSGTNILIVTAGTNQTVSLRGDLTNLTSATFSAVGVSSNIVLSVLGTNTPLAFITASGRFVGLMGTANLPALGISTSVGGSTDYGFFAAANELDVSTKGNTVAKFMVNRSADGDFNLVNADSRLTFSAESSTTFLRRASVGTFQLTSNLLVSSTVTATNGFVGTNGFITFPQVATNATANAGGATLPANPMGFFNATLTNGTQVKIPFYLP